MRPYRIALADDHTLIRQGIKRIVEEMHDLKVIGEASDGLELLALLTKIEPDMLLVDISMPNLRGIEATSEIKAIYPDMKVMILTMHKNKDFLYEAFSAGADGYLLKEDADDELFSAVETIRQGGYYISSKLSPTLTDEFVKMSRGRIKPFVQILSWREKEILKLVSEGKSNKDISALLSISIRTVEHHREHIKKKLRLKNTAD